MKRGVGEPQQTALVLLKALSEPTVLKICLRNFNELVSHLVKNYSEDCNRETGQGHYG